MLPNPQFLADFVTFTEETFNGKLHFLCSGAYAQNILKSEYSDINFIGLYYSRKALWLEYELLWEFFRAIT